MSLKNEEREEESFQQFIEEFSEPKKRNRKSKKQNEKEIMKNFMEEEMSLEKVEFPNINKINEMHEFTTAAADGLTEETKEELKEPKKTKRKSANSTTKHKNASAAAMEDDVEKIKETKEKETHPVVSRILPKNKRAMEEKMVKPKNPSQNTYVDMLNNKEKKIIFAIGPAGTGKTLFATQFGMKNFLLGNFDKIVFTRPTVTVDEDIGFLPGSIEDKLSPWLRPIFDILYEFMTVKEVHSFLEEKTFEMAPIGYLRGRTFKRTFIIADEMQNCTQNQMKMLLTRLGENSRMVITGDLEQHDRTGQTNGLADFLNKLRKKRSDSIGSVEFAQTDILREPIIKEVLEIYSV